MTAPLPRRTPGAGVRRTPNTPTDDWQPFGVPSPDLVARSEHGWKKFLARSETSDRRTAEERG